jgi:hypothetical protein
MNLEEYQSLSEKGQSDVMFKLLIQEDYIDHGRTLKHGNAPIYCLKMAKNPRPDFPFEMVDRTFNYLLKTDFLIAFSFADERVNKEWGYKQVYFMYAEHYNKLHKKKVLPYIQKINTDTHPAFTKKRKKPTYISRFVVCIKKLFSKNM